MFNTTQEMAKAIRREIIKMLTAAGSGHPGGSLSAADIMAVLYGEELNIDAQNPRWEERDRFILSKGHACPALYAALALKGYCDVEELANLRRLGSRFQGHPDMKKLPGVDMSTGSLGQGLSAACGIALAARLNGQNHHIFVLMGDGEVEEGQVWEAAMFAAHYRLNKIIAFVDHNGLQIDGKISDVLSPEPLDAKFAAFGWAVQVIDGHNHDAIKQAIAKAKAEDKPAVIISNTVKGKGVSFMEDKAEWHGNAPKADQATAALAELA